MNEYNDKTEYTDNTIDLCECMFDVEYSWLMVTTIKDNYLFFGQLRVVKDEEEEEAKKE